MYHITSHHITSYHIISYRHCLWYSKRCSKSFGGLVQGLARHLAHLHHLPGLSGSVGPCRHGGFGLFGPTKSRWFRWFRHHWIGLREHLQETMVLPSNIGLSCKFSHLPILWRHQTLGFFTRKTGGFNKNDVGKTRDLADFLSAKLRDFTKWNWGNSSGRTSCLSRNWYFVKPQLWPFKNGENEVLNFASSLWRGCFWFGSLDPTFELRCDLPIFPTASRTAAGFWRMVLCSACTRWCNFWQKQKQNSSRLRRQKAPEAEMERRRTSPASPRRGQKQGMDRWIWENSPQRKGPICCRWSWLLNMGRFLGRWRWLLHVQRLQNARLVGRRGSSLSTIPRLQSARVPCARWSWLLHVQRLQSVRLLWRRRSWLLHIRSRQRPRLLWRRWSWLLHIQRLRNARLVWKRWSWPLNIRRLQSARLLRERWSRVFAPMWCRCTKDAVPSAEKMMSTNVETSILSLCDRCMSLIHEDKLCSRRVPFRSFSLRNKDNGVQSKSGIYILYTLKLFHWLAASETTWTESLHGDQTWS